MIVLRPEQLEVAEALLTVYEGLPVVDAAIEAKAKAVKAEPAPKAERAPRISKPPKPTTRCTICKVALVDLDKHMAKRHPSVAKGAA